MDKRLLVAILTALVLLEIGAAALAADKDVTELTLWNLPRFKPASSPGNDATLRKLDLFLAENPQIWIKRGGGPQLQRSGRGTREFLMAQAAGIAPDVIRMSDADLQNFIPRNFLLPLDNFLLEAGMLDSLRRDSLASHVQKDGHIYALPRGSNRYSYVLVYRKDLFSRAGLDPDKPPTTWDEFLRCAELLTDPPNGKFGFVLPTTKISMPAGAFVELMMALNGVEVIRETRSDNWVADFASDERAVQALEFIKELIGRNIEREGKMYRGIVSTSAGRVDDSIMVARGEAAMIFQQMPEIYSLYGRGVAARDIGVALLPLGPSGDGFVPLRTNGGWYVGINSTCPTESRRRAAWEWLRFLSRKDLGKIDALTYLDWGWVELIDPRDVEGDPELSGLSREVPEQWGIVWHKQVENAKPLLLCPQHSQLRQDYLSRPVWALMENPDQDVRTLLQQTEMRINKELFGSVSEKVKRSRPGILIWVATPIAVLALFVIVYKIIRGMARMLSRNRHWETPSKVGQRRLYVLALIFMIPALGSVILWKYLPLIRGVIIAFQDYQIVGETRWVGLQNFVDVLNDRKFWISLVRTFQYAGLYLSLGFLAPIILAFLLSEVRRGKVLFRVLFYLPALTSGLVIMFLWKWMYDPTPQGLINTLIANLGCLFGVEWGPYKWLDSGRLAMISVVLPTVWAGVGPGSIIYLAALQGVPQDLYEAADLDGAGTWQKITNVSIPFIKPLIIINFLGMFIATFHTMQNIFVMTQGGPGDATYVAGLYIFFNSFVWLKFGKATAAAWILGSLLIGFTVYQLRILKQLRFQAGKSGE